MAQGHRAESEGDREVSTAETPRKRVNGAAKGAKYERDLADYFVALGYENARRMIRTGTVKHADEGDIDGLPFTVQAKTLATPPGDALLTQWLTQTLAQTRARKHQLGLLVVKRNGHAAIGASWVHTDALALTWLGGLMAVAQIDFTTLKLMQHTPVQVRLDELGPLLLNRYPPE